jgi:hypothetical protein
MVPGEDTPVSVQALYGVEHARQVVEAAMADYQELCGENSEHCQ